jgi:predicted GIY-YIG superfamily endonuclease/predicted acetyltransferase
MFVYVLHFDTPLAHAQHYVGMTGNLARRLQAHASGHGSILTRELFDKSLPWVLGGLFQTTPTNARRVEKNLKESKQISRYCDICTPDHPAPPASKSYPLTEVTFPTRSTEIAIPKIGEVRVTIRQGFDQLDQLFASSIQRKHKVELGFLNFEALSTASGGGKLLVADVNETPAGFLIYTRFIRNTTVTVHQCAVLDEFRMIGVGRDLVSTLAAMNPGFSMWCKVRRDLPANYFWEAIGFKKKQTIVHKTSKQELNQYFKENPRCLAAHQVSEKKPCETTSTASTLNETKKPANQSTTTDPPATERATTCATPTKDSK